MDTSAGLLQATHELLVRAATDPPAPDRPPAYKAVGITLAISSGVFIGISFVLKKVGLLRANVKYNEEAGEGYGYLKNAYWWTGMTLMILGEICNFVAYAFVDAILVTPLGALSVVITTILSAIFLKERLSFVGKVGCFICIIGSIVIVMNAPAQSSVNRIQDMKGFVIAPGFLTYAGVIIIGCAFVAWWAGPRYGKQSMMVYLTICSLIGGLSVVATQGLGAAVVAQTRGEPQFNQWFLYVLLVFVICTLLTEIIYLNVSHSPYHKPCSCLTILQKALNLFNAALVTPTYYVYFTSATIVSSAILFRGFKGTPTSIATVVMGFLQICSGVVLLQLSKSAKDVPDAAVFSGDMDQVRTIAEQEQPESEPKADAIRGTAALIRRLSQSRQKMEAAEAKRIHEDKMKDHMEPIGENETVEWDGLRRRKTTIGSSGSLHRRKTLHPPLGMTHFPDTEDDAFPELENDGEHQGVSGSFLKSFRRPRARSALNPGQTLSSEPPTIPYPHPFAQSNPEDLSVAPYNGLNTGVNTHYSNQPDGAMELGHIYGLPPSLQKHGLDGAATSPASSSPSRPIAWAADVEDRPRSADSRGSHHPGSTAKRQFSFQNVFHRHKPGDSGDSAQLHSRKPVSRQGLGSRQGSKEHGIPGIKNATEEERLGLVKGDSSHMVPLVQEPSDDELDALGKRREDDVGDKEMEAYEARRQRWGGGAGKGDSEESGSEGELMDAKYQELGGRGAGRGGGGGGGGNAGAFI